MCNIYLRENSLHSKKSQILENRGKIAETRHLNPRPVVVKTPKRRLHQIQTIQTNMKPTHPVSATDSIAYLSNVTRSLQMGCHFENYICAQLSTRCANRPVKQPCSQVMTFLCP